MMRMMERKDGFEVERLAVAICWEGAEGRAGRPIGIAALTVVRRAEGGGEPERIPKEELRGLANRFLAWASELEGANLFGLERSAVGACEGEEGRGPRDESSKWFSLRKRLLAKGAWLGSEADEAEAATRGEERLERLSLALEAFAKAEGLKGAAVTSFGWKASGRRGGMRSLSRADVRSIWEAEAREGAERARKAESLAEERGRIGSAASEAKRKSPGKKL